MSVHHSDLLGEAEDHGEGSHGPTFYTVIATILCIITAIEVACLYEPLLSLPEGIRVVILVGLSIVKFVMVVAFFMHLYFDHFMTTVLFLIGLVLATGTVAGLVHLIPKPEHELQVIPKSERKEHKADEHHAHRRLPAGLVIS